MSQILLKNLTLIVLVGFSNGMLPSEAFENRKVLENPVMKLITCAQQACLDKMTTNAVANDDGNKLFNSRKYAEAVEKYDEAIRSCPSNRIDLLNIYKNNKADSLYILGDLLWNSKDFNGASEKYDLAYQTCADEEKKIYYKEERNHAKSIALNDEGVSLINQKRFTEALERFEIAIRICPSEKIGRLNTYKDNKAFALHRLGDVAWSKGDFDGAVKNFQLAFETCVDQYTKQWYKNERDHANAEVLSQKGLKLFRENKFSEAIEQFDAAIKLVPSDRVNTLNNYINNKVVCLQSIGTIQWNNGNYHDAADTFELASKASNDEKTKQFYRDEADLAKAEAFNQEGTELYGDKKFALAVEKFIAAVKKLPKSNTDRLNVFTSNEVEALIMLGDSLLESRNINGALEKYELAYQICNDVELKRYLKQKKDQISSDSNSGMYNEDIKLSSDALYAQGSNLRNRKDFNGAAKLFDDASANATDEMRKKFFKDEANSARAEALNEEGHELYKSHKCVEAIAKFEAAIKICSQCKANLVESHNKQKAVCFSQLGNDLARKNDFKGAVQRFGSAYMICSENSPFVYTANSYYLAAIDSWKENDFYQAALKFFYAYQACADTNMATLLQNENDFASAEAFNKEGLQFFAYKRYIEAIEKYDAAINKIPSSKTVEVNAYKNNKAEALYELGKILLNKNDVNGAKEKFESAYNTCVDPVRKQFFQNEANRSASYTSNHDGDAVTLNNEGEKFYNEKKYVEAIEKFNEALKKSSLQNILSDSNIYKKNLAKSHHALGDQLRNKNDFSGAEVQFKLAFLNCPEGVDKEFYGQERDRACASVLKQEGDQLKNFGNYAEAIIKYNEAIKKLPPNSIQDINSLKKKLADCHFVWGEQLSNKNDFSGAEEQFNLAYLNCPEGVDKEFYRRERDRALASVLNLEGDQLKNSGRYIEALEKYAQAIKKLPSGSITSVKMLQQKRAETFNLEGLSLMKENKFKEAIEKFKSASELSVDQLRKEVFEKNLKLATNAFEGQTEAQTVEEAELLNRKGIELLKENKFVEAIEKFDEAMSKLPAKYIIQSFNFRKNKINALVMQGDELMSQKNYSKAHDVFANALQTCGNVCDNKEQIENSLKQARDEDFFAQGMLLWNQGDYYGALGKLKFAAKSADVTRKEFFVQNLEKLIDEMVAKNL